MRPSLKDLATILSRNPDLRVSRGQDVFSQATLASQPLDAPSKPSGGKKQGRSKYRNQKTTVGAFTFDSKREAKRYQELELMQKKGLIRALATQPSYDLWANNQRICRYKADFYYIDTVTGKAVVEDCKGFRTPVYKLKKKLMKVLLGIEVLET